MVDSKKTEIFLCMKKTGWFMPQNPSTFPKKAVWISIRKWIMYKKLVVTVRQSDQFPDALCPLQSSKPSSVATDLLWRPLSRAVTQRLALWLLRFPAHDWLTDHGAPPPENELSEGLTKSFAFSDPHSLISSRRILDEETWVFYRFKTLEIFS